MHSVLITARLKMRFGVSRMMPGNNVIVRVTHSWDGTMNVFTFDDMASARTWVENFYSDCDISEHENIIEVYF